MDGASDLHAEAVASENLPLDRSQAYWWLDQEEMM
jgi:hypothetical protein